MKLSEFKIGEEFTADNGNYRWRCTDVGTRTIAAVKLDSRRDASWYNGPPYAVPELVFDEHSQEDCEPA